MGYSAAYAVAHGVNPDNIVYYDHLTVGNPTEMRGDFFTELWGNVTSDIDVRDLLHGYDLVYWSGEEGKFAANPTVVTSVSVTENAAKDKTYRFTLNENLRYSDGSYITAWDYAFTFLLLIAPELQGAGGTPKRTDYISGYGNYVAGREKALSGIRVTNNRSISITLDHNYLPFFYEMGLLSCNPYPITVIAPGVSVRDDGKGIYLEGAFTSELLNRTLNDPETGYRTHPSVVSGPYTIKSFDGVTAEFEKNPYFIGNAKGELPLIINLTYTLADNETMMGKLESGEFDLLNKVLKADSITKGLILVGGGKTSMSNYPRTGLSYISFACEKPAVASTAVRQAIAYCMDREAIIREYSGNYGTRVDGYYGVGQWMYGIVTGTIAPPVNRPATNDKTAQEKYKKELAAWEQLSLKNLNIYAVNLDKASNLLLSDGWQKNSEGICEKWIDGQAVKLDLTMAYPEGNRIAECLEKYLIPNLEKIGIKLTLKPVPMDKITEIAYSGEERDVELFYQPSNFDLLFDPAVYFTVEGGKPGPWSFSRQTDAELYRRALAMRETEPGAYLAYMQKWVLFQERFNEVLPAIPIYSNTYFDFYTSQLHDYNIAQSVTWAEAILGATKADIP